MTKQLFVFLVIVIALVGALYYWHINSGNPYDAKAFFGSVPVMTVNSAC